MKNLICLISIVLLLASCSEEVKVEVDNDTIESKDTIVKEPMNLVEHSYNVLLAIASKDFNSLATFAHPEKGIKFAPYAFIADDSKTISKNELESMLPKYAPITWGEMDGSGETIQMNIVEYFNQYVYDVDYLTADTLAVNGIIGKGNSINNIKTVYPNSEFVEYHFSGFDPTFNGMDWKSLRLVYELVDDKYYLVAIVNDQWTI